MKVGTTIPQPVVDSNRRYEGRVTIDAEGFVIGSGGASIGNIMRVERGTEVIGTTSRVEFERALATRTKLVFRPANSD